MNELDDEITSHMAALIDNCERDAHYEISEESDVYGFCLNREVLGAWENSSKINSVFSSIRNHENWNNPGSVSLMLRAYKIQDAFTTSIRSQLGSVSIDQLQQSMVDFQAEKFVKIGLRYLQSNDFGTALKYFENALQVHPLYIPALKYKAHLLLQSSAYLEAKEVIKVILDKDSRDSEGLSMLSSLPADLRSDDRRIVDSFHVSRTMERISKSLTENVNNRSSKISKEESSSIDEDSYSRKNGNSSSDTDFSEDSSYKNRKRKKAAKKNKKKKSKHKKDKRRRKDSK